MSRGIRSEDRDKSYPIEILASGAALPRIRFLLPPVTRCGHHVAVCPKRSADGWRRRSSVILGRKLSASRGVALRVLYLRAHARSSWFTRRGYFRWLRPHLNAARSTIEAGAGNAS